MAAQALILGSINYEVPKNMFIFERGGVNGIWRIPSPCGILYLVFIPFIGDEYLIRQIIIGHIQQES